ncbi:hypothetical protein STSO111631_12890 [Stackebrandtia soli]
MWLTVVACLAGVITASACAAGGWMLLRDDPAAAEPNQQHTDENSVPRDDVPDAALSRETDPEPVTADELFSESALDGYTVLGTDEVTKCADAAVGAVGDLLADGDCTQVVRATVVAPDGAYVATVGVVNLVDDAAASSARDAIEAGVDGGFAALRTEGAGSELGLSPTVLGFNTYGHYLLYVVIGRVDGEAPAGDDPAVGALVSELVDTHLIRTLKPRSETQD